MNEAKLQRELERYRARTAKSSQLQEEAQRYLPGGSTRGAQFFDPYPIFIDHGQGHHIFDADGNGYLDFMINATSLVMGHAHPEVVRALQEQAERGTAFSGPTETLISLSKLLCDRIPSVDTIRFTNSGTEGTLMAIRAARAFTGRPKIAKFEGGYHGSHESASVSVAPSADSLDPAGPTAIPEYPGQPQGILDDVIVMPYNDLETSERLIRAHGDELSCVIMEPISSSFGYLPADLGFLQGIRDVTEELGILLIFDEVQSFRVAPGGAQEMFGVVPDFTAMGKIIGGGMAVGAFGGREDLMSQFDPTGGGPAIAHSGTFNANPMTAVAGEVTMRHLTPEVYARMNGLGEMLREKLRAVFAEFEVSAKVTGVASLFGVHFTSEEISDYRSVLRGDGQMKKALFTGLLNEGVLVMSGASGALNALTTESEVDTLVDATRQVIQRIR